MNQRTVLKILDIINVICGFLLGVMGIAGVINGYGILAGIVALIGLATFGISLSLIRKH